MSTSCNKMGLAVPMILCLVGVSIATSPGYISVPLVPIPIEDVSSTPSTNSTPPDSNSTTTDCTCVPYYRCMDKFPDDSGDLILIRVPVEKECDSYLDICCKSIGPESMTGVDEQSERKPMSTAANPASVGNTVVSSPPDCTCVQLFGCPDKVNTSLEANPTGNEKCDFDLCCNSAQDQPTASVSTNKSSHLQPHLASCGHRNLHAGLSIKSLQLPEYEAQYAEFPWTVAVNHLQVENKEAYVCGGSLIHPQVVLTGAHCVQKENLFIRAGEWDMETENEIYPTQDRNVSQVIVHEEFNPDTLANGIALLVLESPVDIRENEAHIGVVCLPQENEDFNGRSNCVASGWGKVEFGENTKLSPILKKIDLPIVPRDICVETLRKTKLGPRFKLHSSFICAGGVLGHDTCTGDGGSPLVCPTKEDPDKYVQAGIVAWGIGCGTDNPATYINVAGFLPWIYDKLEKHLPKV